MYKEFLEIVGNGSPTGSVSKETIAVSATIVNKRVTQSKSPNSFMQRRENHREPEVPEVRSPSGRMSRWPCKDYLKGTCNNSFCERWHPPECLFCSVWGKVAHRQVDEQPTKRSKKNDDKSAVAMLKKGDWHESVREPVTNYVKVTIDQGDLIRNVITSWNEDLLNVDHRMHDNWVVYFKT